MIQGRGRISEQDECEILRISSEALAHARPVILSAFGATHNFALKDDSSPVTDVDLRVEEIIRAVLERETPDWPIVAEETSPNNIVAEYNWVLDPIDGTRSFMHGIPTFGTLLTVRHYHTPLIGIIDHPVLGLRYSGGPHQGACRNGVKITMSPWYSSEELSENDIIATSTPRMFKKAQCENIQNALTLFHANLRIYNDCFAHSQTVQGSIRVTVECGLQIWDLAATSALIASVGGQFATLWPKGYSGDESKRITVFAHTKTVAQFTQYLITRGHVEPVSETDAQAVRANEI